MRIGDTERESALTALSNHYSEGRLDIDEYGERTAKVTAAKTRGELLDLFTDLPAPHPEFGSLRPGPQPAQAPTAQQQGPVAPMPHGALLSQRLMGAAVPIAAIVAVVLFFGVIHLWWVFLLPVAVGMLGGAIFGDEWKQRERLRKEYYRQQRRELRRRGRGW
jgi:hypothetical protein